VLIEADRQELRALHESLGTGPTEIGHYFSLPQPPGREPAEFASELRDQGFEVVVDEELSGDGYWHVAAFRTETLTEWSLAEIRSMLATTARHHNMTYDGWNWRTTVALQQRFPKR
jgi:Regulator of ribonuclease activity B